MIKRFGKSGFGNDGFESDGADPMAGVSNMSDAMLVLAVGIMMALVINWRIDIKPQNLSEVDTENLTEITEYDSMNSEDLIEQEGLTGLEEKGTVYVDPETGKIYVVVDEE